MWKNKANQSEMPASVQPQRNFISGCWGKVRRFHLEFVELLIVCELAQQLKNGNGQATHTVHYQFLIINKTFKKNSKELINISMEVVAYIKSKPSRKWHHKETKVIFQYWFCLLKGVITTGINRGQADRYASLLTSGKIRVQVSPACCWLVWQSKECHFLLANALVPDTSGMPPVISHWSALVCVSVCVHFCWITSNCIWEGNEPNRDVQGVIVWSHGWFKIHYTNGDGYSLESTWVHDVTVYYHGNIHTTSLACMLTSWTEIITDPFQTCTKAYVNIICVLVGFYRSKKYHLWCHKPCL